MHYLLHFPLLRQYLSYIDTIITHLHAKYSQKKYWPLKKSIAHISVGKHKIIRMANKHLQKED